MNNNEQVLNNLIKNQSTWQNVSANAVPTGTEDEYEKTGQCMDITEIDLDKLDTSSRGSIVSSAYSFGLVYWVTQYPEYCHLIDKIIIDVGIKNHDTICTLTVQ